MPGPTPLALAKTWQFATNLNPGLNGSDQIDTGKMMILIINALLGFGLSPWTCVGSSDSATAGMDATNRLTDYTKIVTGGGNHSWIVLQQSGMNALTQICIDFNQDMFHNGNISLYWSPNVGFSGGAINARPTASDEQFSTNAGAAIAFFNGWSFTGNGMGMRAHVMQSTDGQCTRIFLAQAHQVRTWLQFDVPSSPVSGWANPVIAIMQTASGAPTAWGAQMFQEFIQAVGPVAAMPMLPCYMGDGNSGNVQGFNWTLTDQFSGQYGLYTIGMYHNVTTGQKGRHGSLFDSWMAPSLALPGTSFPNNGSKLYILMGNLVQPWNGGDIEMG